MYIRYNTNNNKVISISQNELKKIKNSDILKITKTQYNKIKNKDMKQLYVVNNKIKVIDDELFQKQKEAEKNKKIEIENRKTIEKKILSKYPYYGQINNVYKFLLLVEEPLKILLKYDEMNKNQKLYFDETYNMINEIFTDLEKYKIAQKNKEKLSFNN